MKKILSLLAVSMLIISCSNAKKETETVQDVITPVADAAHTSQNSLDYKGTYKGVLPCADCDSIVVFITLGENDYTLISESFKNKNSVKFEDKGTYTWDASGNAILLDGIADAPNKYAVGENKLTQLDMDGNVITGNLASMYVLLKQ